MRFRSGCPSKRMPIRSKLSRSCQFAVGQTEVTDGNHGFVARQAHLQPQAVSALDRKQVVIHFEARLQRKAVDRR